MTPRQLLLLAMLTPAAAAYADHVDLREYALLRRGMSEAEVLYRIGPYDHQSVYHDHYDYVTKKIWYYIPDGSYSGDWITEITFDRHGIVTELNRFKARP
jgi:hypothetical protein